MPKKLCLFIFLFSLFYFLSLFISKQSLAQGRLYQCVPAFDYASSPANCGSGPPVDCVDPDGRTVLAPDGNTCAAWTAAWYTSQGDPVTATCEDRCTDPFLVNNCSRDAFNTCTFATCAGGPSFCINYVEVTPTPTPTSSPTPTPTNTPTPTPTKL